MVFWLQVPGLGAHPQAPTCTYAHNPMWLQLSLHPFEAKVGSPAGLVWLPLQRALCAGIPHWSEVQRHQSAAGETPAGMGQPWDVGVPRWWVASWAQEGGVLLGFQRQRRKKTPKEMPSSEEGVQRPSITSSFIASLLH
jgi:hypothetical protein